MNVMKKILSYVSIALCLFTFSACDSSFLDRASKSELSEEVLWKTADDAVQAVNALYHSNREYYNQIVIYGFLDDFTDCSYQSFATGMTTGSYPTNAAFFLNPWISFYKGIYRANTAIKRLPDMNIDENLKKQCLGEAYFFRGYFYFKLWDLYGAVPVYDTPMSPSEAYKPRAKEEEVYKLIVDDMTQAFSMLAASYTGSDVGRATKWAALSMRGKAHLWAKEYASAAADFKQVMTESGRSLYPDYSTIFHIEGNNCSEIIFDVQYFEQSGQGLAVNVTWGTQSGAFSGQQRCRPTNELVNAFEMKDGTPFDFKNFKNAKGETFNPDNAADWEDEASVRALYENRDPRLQASVIVPWSTYVGKDDKSFIYRYPADNTQADQLKLAWMGNYVWRKFLPAGTKNNTIYNQVPQNLPLIRLADVMLMYAEAQNEASSPDNSVYEALNAVRRRAGVAEVTETLTKDQMREKIRHERMVELCAEGIRYSDIRRWKIAKDVVDGVWMKSFIGANIRQRGFPDNFYLWPIPQAEIDQNPALEQNPGWN